LKMIASLLTVLRYALTWHEPPLSFDLNAPEATTLEMWKKQYRERLPAVSDSDPMKFGFFAVNLKYGQSVLIEEFTKELRHFEGKPMVEFPPPTKQPMKPKPPGRKSIRDGLN